MSLSAGAIRRIIALKLSGEAMAEVLSIFADEIGQTRQAANRRAYDRRKEISSAELSTEPSTESCATQGDVAELSTEKTELSTEIQPETAAPRVGAPACVLYGEEVLKERNIPQTPCLPLDESSPASDEQDKPLPRKPLRRDTKADDAVVENFLELYAATAKQCSLPAYRAITDRRRSCILARARDMVSALEFPTPEAGFIEMFNKIRGSPFLTGQTGNRAFRADMDWVINESNCLKIMEGKYAKVEKLQGNGHFSDRYQR